MRAASRAWPLGVAAVVLVAFGLRAWGAKHGLPYVYNADENAHFVPRAIGMFGHSYNPGYFINPPAFTYLLHGVFFARWGTREAVGDAFARDPGNAFLLARLASGLLGALAVGLLAWAGARLQLPRASSSASPAAASAWTGLLAAALLAVAFLPVHYGHFALNDVPALAPACLALLGAALIARGSGTRAYVVAGAGVGLALAFKYTAGIVALPVAAAALVAPGPWRGRLVRLVLAGAVSVLAFLIANPYALLDFGEFRAGLAKQSATAADGGGKLGLGDANAYGYYLRSLTWGFGWLPLLAAIGGAVVLAVRDRRLALVLVPVPVLLLAFLGGQDRFFARWLLPAYPVLALLAAIGAVAAAGWLGARLGRGRALAAAAGALLCAQGVVFSVHNDLALSRDDTRQLARDWMTGHIPEGEKIVVEPIAPDQWATDVGRPSAVTGNGARWIKFPTSRSRVQNDGTVSRGSRIVKLEDYERTTRPSDVDRYRRAGYCWVVTGSTQFGRAFAEPREVPEAIRYYARLRDEGRVVYRISPDGGGTRDVPFSFDFSFNAYPLGYDRPGPAVEIFRLPDCRGRFEVG